MAAITSSTLPLRPVLASAPNNLFKQQRSSLHTPFRPASFSYSSPRIQSFDAMAGKLRCAIRATAGATQSGNLSELHPSSGAGYFTTALAMVVSRFLVIKSVIVDAFLKVTAGIVGSIQPQERETLACLKSSLACAVSPLCFAALSRSTGTVNTPLTVVASGMAKWLELYSGVLMVRVLLSWFPNIPWERQPLQAMRDMCDPYLNLYRNIIPPLFNALDLSPLLAFLVLGLLTSILNTSIRG